MHTKKLSTAALIGASLLTVMLAGCEPISYPKPQQEVRAGTGFEVAKLFEQDGCSVYRFYDREPNGGSYPKYFVRCAKQKQIVEEHSESCGKGCTRNVQTVTVQDDDR